MLFVIFHVFSSHAEWGVAVPAFGDLWASCGGLQIAGCELVGANVLGHILGLFQIPPTPM